MTKHTKLILLSLVSLLTLTTKDGICQQDPMYSQYMFNMLSVNPAYAGTRGSLSVTSLYRKQWAGIVGAPTTITFSADAPVKNQKMALGFNIVSDKIGISKDLMINALYAYRVYFSNAGVLSLGLQAGVNQYSADYTSVKTATPYGGSTNDRAFGKAMNDFFPNAGFGAYYYTTHFYAGVGIPRLIKNNLRGENKPTLDFTSFPNRQNRHFFLSSGYTFDLDQDWQVKPSAMVKIVKGAPVEADVNANVWWKKTVGAGLSYRTADALVAMLQFKPKKEFEFGYAYDYTVSAFAGSNTGSHELFVRYEPFASKVKTRTSQFRTKKFNQLKKKKHRSANRKAYKLRKRR